MASAHATTNGGSYTGQEHFASSQYSADKAGDKQSAQEEIGWYFVMKYYQTLSEESQKLHLFYNKKSQFIYGTETERTAVCQGRTAIQTRISQLDFAGSKVRIANVDSQPTDGENILIQVIGEISHSKSPEIKKFVETFILAKQANGYFVLNDIFRCLNENYGEEQEAPVAEPAAEPAVSDVAEEPVAEPEAPKVEEPVEEPKAVTIDADLVDEKLESVAVLESTSSTNGNGVTAEADKAVDAPVAPAKSEVPLTSDAAEKEVEEETAKELEKPKEPSPTPAPVAAPPKAKPATPVQPPAPAKALTWASRFAATVGAAKPAPAVPALAKSATPPVQPRAAPSAAAVVAPAAASQASQSTPPTSESAEKDSPAQQGWQTAGSEQKRQARPQSVSSPAVKDDTLGYVRNVTEKVNVEELRATLASFGELVYFDVNRSKNCAFVEFANAAGYNAAAAANPHVLGGENIMVEPRRPKAAAYGGSGYNNNNRGAMNNRGRGNFDQGRPGSQGGVRGGFVQRGGRGGPNGPGAPRATGQRATGQPTPA